MLQKYKDIQSSIIYDGLLLNRFSDLEINNIPVLIDFRTSICIEESYLNQKADSFIKRSSYSKSILLRLAKRLISPVPKITKKNVSLLKELLLKKNNYVSTILVVGGGTIGRGMETIYRSDNIKVVSFDVYSTENVTFIADAHDIPIKDNSVDAVIIQYVLEHVAQPNIVVAEIRRVLKNNGLVYAETPFLEQVHESGYDFTRFTHSGHRYLFKEFSEVKSGIVCGAGTHLLWSLEYLLRGLFRSKKIGKIFKLFFFWVQYIDFLIPERYQVDMADSFYFLGSKAEVDQMSIKELANYYKGSDDLL